MTEANWRAVLDAIELRNLPHSHIVPGPIERAEEAEILFGLALWFRDERGDEGRVKLLDQALGKRWTPHRDGETFWWFAGGWREPSFHANWIPLELFRKLKSRNTLTAEYNSRSAAWFALLDTVP